MTRREFAPGFRLSFIDVVVLVVGGVAAVVLWMMTWWWGFVVAFVLGHFFFFCNLLRASRPLELAWAGVFVVVAIGTITADVPGWPTAITIALGATLLVAVFEMRKPSYHGIGWQTINPGLRTWWQATLDKANPA